MRLYISKFEPLGVIKGLIILVYFLIIFDGALRKWILPSLSGPLFFAKDPIVLLVYFYCLKYDLFPKATRYILLASCLYALLGLAQSAFLNIPLEVVFVGCRNYFLLLPLVLIIWKHFDWMDVVKILKAHLLLAIPIAILAYLQYTSPVSSWINRGVGVDGADAFEVVKGVVRTYGLFSFTDGQAIYINFLFAVLLIYLLLPKEYGFVKKWTFPVIAFSAMLCLAVSGSRSAIGYVLLLLGIVLVFAILNPRSNKALKYLFVLAIGFGFASFLGTTVFSKNINHLKTRMEVAGRSEKLSERILGPLSNLGATIQRSSFLGAGIGSSSGAGAKFIKGSVGFLLGEGEWENIILESGFFLGLVFLFFRIAITIFLFVKAVKSYLSTNEIVPMVMVAGVSFLLIQGQVIRGGTQMYFCWMFVGLSLAIIRNVNEAYGIYENREWL